jgi:hypothetical protein
MKDMNAERIDLEGTDRPKSREYTGNGCVCISGAAICEFIPATDETDRNHVNSVNGG